MKSRRVSIVIFYDKDKVLIQDRRKISKYGEEYGFFGGGIEEGETPEQALKREIKEELSITIDNFKLFKHYNTIIKEVDMEIEYFIYTSKIPDLNSLDVKEGKMVMFDLNKTLKLKMISEDSKILKEFIKLKGEIE